MLGLMRYFNNYSTTAYLYAAMHGSYGLLWLLKDTTFPDPGWQRKATILSGVCRVAPRRRSAAVTAC